MILPLMNFQDPETGEEVEGRVVEVSTKPGAKPSSAMKRVAKVSSYILKYVW